MPDSPADHFPFPCATRPDSRRCCYTTNDFLPIQARSIRIYCYRGLQKAAAAIGLRGSHVTIPLKYISGGSTSTNYCSVDSKSAIRSVFGISNSLLTTVWTTTGNLGTSASCLKHSKYRSLKQEIQTYKKKLRKGVKRFLRVASLQPK